MVTRIIHYLSLNGRYVAFAAVYTMLGLVLSACSLFDSAAVHGQAPGCSEYSTCPDGSFCCGGDGQCYPDGENVPDEDYPD